jgi:hypothetical protein
VREYDASLDCLVESEAFGGLQNTEFLVHRFVHDFADEALVGGPLRESEWLGLVEDVSVSVNFILNFINISFKCYFLF